MAEFEIEASSLIDSPYRSGKEKLFAFDRGELNDLIEDIRLSPPSCYLLSGYRGVGKTSFIKRAESLVVHNKNVHGEGDKIVFVYASFAKYESQSYLIRKLIRQLFITLDSSGDYKKLNLKAEDVKELNSRLTLLYERTFQDISEVRDEKQVNESTRKWGYFDLSFKSILNILAPSFLLLITSLSTIEFYLSNAIKFLGVIVPISSFLWLVLAAYKVSKFTSKTRREEKRLLRTTLYDDEIASHHLFDLLGRLQKQDLKIVFVLDELDKVKSAEVDKLLNEMKPLLVSGLASFIVVSGQKLFYKYYEDQNRDDSVLSSLFSKVLHISLTTPATMRLLFHNNILKGGDSYREETKVELNTLLDFFIFKSRLVPRRFTNIIRQNMYFKEGKAYISNRNLPKNYFMGSKMPDVISSISDTYILPDGHDKAIRDYMISSLYLKANEKIFNKNKLRIK